MVTVVNAGGTYAATHTRLAGAYGLEVLPSHLLTSFYDLVQTLALSSRRTLFELLCESRMNISNLEVPPPQQVQRISNEGSDKDADVRPSQIHTDLYSSDSNLVSFITTFE